LSGNSRNFTCTAIKWKKKETSCGKSGGKEEREPRERLERNDGKGRDVLNVTLILLLDVKVLGF